MENCIGWRAALAYVAIKAWPFVAAVTLGDLAIQVVAHAAALLRGPPRYLTPTFNRIFAVRWSGLL